MDPVESRAFVTALQSAIFAAERVDRTAVIDGMEMRFQFSPSPDVDVRITAQQSGRPDEQAAMVLYNSASAPPDSYPPDLPFLAGVPVSVWDPTGAPTGNRSATWWSVPDSEAAEAQIVEQSASAGWVTEASPPFAPDLPMRILLLRQGTRSRMVTLTSMGSASMVMVVDTEDGPEAVE